MCYNKLRLKLERIFEDVGFERISIGGVQLFKLKECYCKLTYVHEFRAFVIESAETYIEAKAGVFEDGDLYYTDTDENQLISMFRQDLCSNYT